MKRLTLTGAGGGGITALGVLNLDRCTFVGNSTTSGGGAIAAEGTFSATRCTFFGNSAQWGGAMMVNSGTADLSHCTFLGNRSIGLGASSGGGAVDIFEGFAVPSPAVVLQYCLFSGNSSFTGTGPDIWYEGGSVTTSGNLVGNGKDSGITDGANGNIIGTPAVPINAGVAALDNYGGLTKTVLVLPGSPAINAATGSTHTTDQRGFPVIGVPDIGAVEFQGNDDLGGFWLLDSDGDGVRFGAEFALGMNLAANDPGNAKNLKVTKNGSGNPVITLGRNPAANSTTTWRVSRSTTLLPGSFTEIFRYVGPTNFAFTTGSSAIVNPDSFQVTDTNPPAGGKAFYRFEAVSP